MSKTKIIIQARDGRKVERVFDTYAEAIDFCEQVKKTAGVEVDIEEARFDREPTIEIYREKTK